MVSDLIRLKLPEADMGISDRDDRGLKLENTTKIVGADLS